MVIRSALSLSWALLVEFWWCFEARLKCARLEFWLSCETPAAPDWVPADLA